MKQVEELVGVFGNTPASVISRIVEHFFDYGKFDDVLGKLRAKKRELYPPDTQTIHKKIINLFKAANKIPFQEFCDFLEIDKKYAFENLHIWTEKYKIRVIEKYVIKEPGDEK
ncbi:MAG: hypothetical protein ACFE85_19230, partial [Candidatus Hodarchaeota archaeon]